MSIRQPHFGNDIPDVAVDPNHPRDDEGVPALVEVRTETELADPQGQDLAATIRRNHGRTPL